MKRITRTIAASGVQVWLTELGRWSIKPEDAYEFEDADASARLKRIPRATTEDVDKTPEKDNAN